MHLFTAFSMSNEEAVADPRNMLIYDMYKFLRAAPCPAVTGRRQWHAPSPCRTRRHAWAGSADVAPWPPGPPDSLHARDNGLTTAGRCLVPKFAAGHNGLSPGTPEPESKLR